MKICGRNIEFQKTVPGFFFVSSEKKIPTERETPNLLSISVLLLPVYYFFP